MQRGGTPYSQFGRRLAEIRNSLRESVHEVSGAVEVDSEIIEKFESGENRPSEDMLLLLISHFDVKDEDADELFELAGYSTLEQSDPSPQLPTLVMVPFDSRVVYTDFADVSANENGVVISFMQDNLSNQSAPVSRVGMSLVQAKKLLKNIQESIDKAEGKSQPKLIGAPIKSAKPTKKTPKQ